MLYAKENEPGLAEEAAHRVRNSQERESAILRQLLREDITKGCWIEKMHPSTMGSSCNLNEWNLTELPLEII